MQELLTISKKLWRLLLQVVMLTIGLGKQTILPNRKRKGNLLNVLFLFYIGMIENIRQFEHRNFKMADLLQNSLVRKGLILLTFLLFFLTCYEQPALPRASYCEPDKVACSYQNASHQSSYRRCIHHCCVPVRLLPVQDFPFRVSDSSQLPLVCSKRYLQIRCLLI